MLYLKVKYRSNEVSLRVEYPSVTQTLLGLETISCSAEWWLRLFETLEPPVHMSPFGGLWVRAQVVPTSRLLHCWPNWPQRWRWTKPEDFSQQNISQMQDVLSQNSLLIPFWGSTGSCWPKSLAALLWCPGEREECCWGDYSTHMNAGTIIQMILTLPSVLTCDNIWHTKKAVRYRQSKLARVFWVSFCPLTADYGQTITVDGNSLLTAVLIRMRHLGLHMMRESREEETHYT